MHDTLLSQFFEPPQLCPHFLFEEHFAEVTPSVDFSGAIWEKCEAFFANSIVSPPALPDCAEEDSAAYILKQKNIMLGGVQFSASLVRCVFFLHPTPLRTTLSTVSLTGSRAK